jgi:hypothetical protein
MWLQIPFQTEAIGPHLGIALRVARCNQHGRARKFSVTSDRKLTRTPIGREHVAYLGDSRSKAAAAMCAQVALATAREVRPSYFTKELGDIGRCSLCEPRGVIADVTHGSVELRTRLHLSVRANPKQITRTARLASERIQRFEIWRLEIGDGVVRRTSGRRRLQTPPFTRSPCPKNRARASQHRARPRDANRC